jgi:uncharacterized protein (DUF2461 family)
MAIAIVRIPGHPTKSAAEDTLTIMQAGEGYIEGSGRVYKEGSTWTAEASFKPKSVKAALKQAIADEPSSRKAAKRKKKKKQRPA